ncbi:phage shock protein A (IM30), suppresses sigma54-dependent transcription [Cylindrospermum stagnale PCC 7417]|uniref:Phage shock protein A (IM30), suppresses sigma54-dependent transcription n=1 Tax=Cylindrospermum stagnale PCC 7417 TaxID=56107 RepID=K9X4H2_9NOST|nr:PspA/IM30 family protein [Cylindrospermum stagnale]AFZ26961.1 phage shock protein A (IM30), suppresses sigma54-dependent transcription [Cylindrospermum stagnale PCC 7417]
MELIKRILRVIRANLNSLVASAEDPEKILEKAFMEMQENLLQLRSGVAGAIATQKRTERQAAAAQGQAEEWYRRAQLALQQGNEVLARVALTKRQAYKETASALSNQIEQQNDVVVKLKQDMRSLELKITEVRTKKDMYIARARSAEASYRLQEMLSGVSATTSLGAFERMEEKVLQIEAKSEAISQLGSDDLEQRFTSLESTNNIDAELATMKTQVINQDSLLQEGNQSSQKQLPNTQ